MEPDNTFSGIFGNKLSTRHKPEPIAQQEDTPAITDQTIADLTEDSGQKTIKEEHEQVQERRLSASVVAGGRALTVPMERPLTKLGTSLASVTKTS